MQKKSPSIGPVSSGLGGLLARGFLSRGALLGARHTKGEIGGEPEKSENLQ
jgi:hypothetical protein